MRLLACFLVFQSFFACQHGPEKLPLSEAGIASNTTAESMPAIQQGTHQHPPSASNIIFQSLDGGETWQDLSDGLPEKLNVWSLYVDGGQVMLGVENGLYHSNNPPMAAAAWQKEMLLDKIVRDIFPGRNGLYAASYGSGFFQKIPGNDVWTRMYKNLEDRNVRSIFEAPDGSILASSDAGIYKSVDGGESWKQVFSEGMVLNLTSKNGVLLGGAFKGIVRSSDGGEHWKWVLRGEGVGINMSIVDDHFVTIIGGNRKNTLHSSYDGGKTWQPLQGEGLPTDGFFSDFEKMGDQLFCTHTDGIFRSTDKGKSWQLIPSSKGKGLSNLVISGHVMYAIMGSGC